MTAAAAAGVEVRELRSLPEQAMARWVFDEVWPGEVGGTQITPNLMQAMVHNGAYLSGAFLDDQIVGAAFAFPGVDEHGLHLHSHMAGVTEAARDRSVGFALKVHQRWWALAEGYTSIRWTFDPLVRRNAVLNLRKLGVDVIGYHENFYGEMPDEVNAGDFSDRMMAEWRLDSDQVEQALTAPLDAVVGTGVHVVVEVPDDIVALRRRDPEQALQWRLRVREEIRPRLDAGWRVVGLSPSAGYVLVPAEAS
jgi:predicted GNAT superfamily acetyltransferase